MTQTAYARNSALGAPGVLASPRRDNVILARIAEGVVDFGYAVTKGTNPETQVTIITGGESVFGIVVNSGDTDADSYADGAMVNVLRSGHCFVTCETAFSVGDAVYVADATGAIRSDNTDATLLPRAVFLSTGGAGSLAAIELNLLGQ